MRGVIRHVPVERGEPAFPLDGNQHCRALDGEIDEACRLIDLLIGTRYLLRTRRRGQPEHTHGENTHHGQQTDEYHRQPLSAGLLKTRREVAWFRPFDATQRVVSSTETI